jgi:GNAT superfamily N-acetyltransferase
MAVITCAHEPLRWLIDSGVKDIVARHWEEIALDKASVPLDTDWDKYQSLEDSGSWRAFAARCDGKLIGYISYFIDFHVRYKTTRYVEADVFYILPEYRNKSRAGLILFQEFLAALPKPCKVLINEKLTFKDGRVGRLLEYLGMKPIEVVYSKFLEG